jgi:hypothetical protein
MAPSQKKKAQATKKATAKKAVRKKEAAVAPGNVRFDPISDQFGPRLQAELEQVARSEAKILKALGNEDLKQLYLADPAAALARMGVSVPPILKQRLKGRPPLNDLVSPRSFRLPNGQVVTATVNVKFTPRKRG